MSEELMNEITKELALQTYKDVAQPALKSVGGILDVIVRTVRAAISPLEKWTLNKEFQVEAVSKLLEEKLKNLTPEQITTPEAYIAVPALQAISYCMDNNELRDMYASLLASSMNKIVKDGVHPSYVEIIRQLCPDEAKLLKIIVAKETIPTISVSYGNDIEGFIWVVRDFSNAGDLADCERPLDICKYLGNLSRLGLIEMPTPSQSVNSSLADKHLYEPLKNHSYIQSVIECFNIKEDARNKIEIIECYASITDYGKGFCAVCLNTETVSETSGREAIIEDSEFMTHSEIATDDEASEMLDETFDCQQAH